MAGETNINALLKNMTPKLNAGEYVFCTVDKLPAVNLPDMIGFFREEEGYTLILNKETADHLNLNYSYIAAWITLTIHSSLEAVGLTAAFATALAKHLVSCNVVAGFYHDHLFVAIEDADKAINVLRELVAKN